jgi:hypothetical protein
MRVPARRMFTAARWPAGVLITGWSYMWRTTPMHRRELQGVWEDDAPPPLPDGVRRDGVLGPEHGAGPLLHRSYRARIVDARLGPSAMIATIAEDPNRVAPGSLARFQKQRGERGRMAVGDEWVVRMPGPWDGPIRVVDLGPEHIRFATLAGHLEAGQIEWRAYPDDGALGFRIDSWARSGDRLSDVMHNRLRMAKEVQLHMWTSVLERVARLAGGRLDGGLDIETRRIEPGALGDGPV